MGPRAGVDGRKISPDRDSIPVRPARSQSLYRLSYPAHTISAVLTFKYKQSVHIPEGINLLAPELFVLILAHSVYKT